MYNLFLMVKIVTILHLVRVEVIIFIALLLYLKVIFLHCAPNTKQHYYMKIHTHVHSHTHTHTHTHIHIYTYTHTHIYIHTQLYYRK